MGYPFAAQTNANDAPVLPPVYSTTFPPGHKRPSSAAREITDSAIRSFILPVGFCYSSFANILPQSTGTTPWSCTSEVFPMEWRMLSFVFIFLAQQ